MSATYTYENVLTVIECCTCHMDFAMSQDFERARRRDHKSWYCPAGHVQFFPGESDIERERRLRREAEEEEARERTRRRAEADQREAAERSLRATKGHLTRQRRRAAHGVCPVCPRTFANVEQHVAKQHPEYVTALRPAGES